MNKQLSTILSIAFELTGLVIAAVFLGLWLEKQFSWPSGYGIAGLVVLSFVAWIIHVVQILKRLEK